MGIEPTGNTIYAPPNGFEDRGHHQVCKHFPVFCYTVERRVEQTPTIIGCFKQAERAPNSRGHC